KYGLWRRDTGVGVAHLGTSDHSALQHQLGLDAKKGWFPQHQVGPLARLDAPHLARDAVRDRWADGVFGDVALGAVVVVAGTVGCQRPELHLHLVGGLPGANDDFADPAHGLGIGADHAQGAAIVQDVLGGDGLGADAAL